MQADKKDILEQLARPIRPHFDLEEMKREQGYQPINREELEELIKAQGTLNQEIRSLND